MNDYTPTTEEVRKGYAGALYLSEVPRDRSEEFDRWLDEVKAEAWQEGWDTKPPYQKINNPYRRGEA